MRRVVALFIALLVATTATAASATAKHSAHHVPILSTHGSKPLRTAILDPNLFGGSDQATAFAMTRAAGASYVRLIVNWSKVAPVTPPAGFVANDPNSPSYDWAAVDATVTAAEQAGLTPLLDVEGAPSWALVVPAHGFHAGTPSAKQLGWFARALAAHYDGSHGAPAVHLFQVWNEPNVTLYLSPVKASSYRAMINYFAAAVHRVSPKNIVVAGALDPFENNAKRFKSVAPLTFMRNLLCMPQPAVKKHKQHKPKTCKAKTHFDVWSHHPYTFGGPFGKARLANDVSLGDLPRMHAVLKAAAKKHRIVHAHPVQFWVTEFGWDTNPPRRGAPGLALEARWAAESLHEMWLSGVSLVTWFLLQDEPSPSPYQSGLYFHSASIAGARAKPGRTAFRFPFVAYKKGSVVTVWGRDATSTKVLVTIQRRHGKRGHWTTVAKIRANRDGIFQGKLHISSKPKDWMRAKAPHSGKSLAFALKQPKYPKLGPWGK